MSYLDNKIYEIYGQRLRNGGNGVGIEVEVEGIGLPAAVNAKWSAVRDGSLRGESFEYVLKGPLDVSVAKEALVELEEKFKEYGSEIKTAHRGSVHVHVNVQNFKYEQVFTTLFMWMLVEPFWLRLCGDTRDGNLFCLPSYLSGDLAQFSESILYACRTGDFMNAPQRGKYASINTDAINNFGSLEFRTFATHTSASVVSKWVDWCHNLVSLGGALPINNMSKTLRDFQSNPRKYLGMVFDKETLGMFSDGDLTDILEVGVEAASPMLVVARNHQKAKEKKANKE